MNWYCVEFHGKVNCWLILLTWIPWNLSFRYISFHENRLQMMLWHHNARVNSHQRWKQTRFRVCFHLWCELTSAMNMEFIPGPLLNLTSIHMRNWHRFAELGFSFGKGRFGPWVPDHCGHIMVGLNTGLSLAALLFDKSLMMCCNHLWMQQAKACNKPSQASVEAEWNRKTAGQDCSTHKP